MRYSFTRNALGKLLTMTDHTGASLVNYFYVLYGHGDVIGLRDSSGELVVSYTYDSFGNILTESGTVTTGDGLLLREKNPFRYASYFLDEETGCYYLEARYYEPKIGRFTTRDLLPSVNLYVYAENNPVNLVDPTGQAPIIEGRTVDISLMYRNVRTGGEAPKRKIGLAPKAVPSPSWLNNRNASLNNNSSHLGLVTTGALTGGSLDELAKSVDPYTKPNSNLPLL